MSGKIRVPRRLALVALLAMLLDPSHISAERAGEARPGAVVRWPGPELIDCSIEERHWRPLDDACWYPIDLEMAGEIELVRRSTGGIASRKISVADYPYIVQRLTVEQKYVSPPQAELDRIARERRRTVALFALETERRFTLPLAAPLAELPTSSRFGVRRIFNDEPRSPHSGADYSATSGSLVYASANGRVVLAEDQYFAGKAVYLDHGDGLLSMSFHLSEILVAQGAEVDRGQPIGRVGATGRVTGPHLHFGLRWHGARVDPDLLIGAAEAVEIR